MAVVMAIGSHGSRLKSSTENTWLLTAVAAVAAANDHVFCHGSEHWPASLHEDPACKLPITKIKDSYAKCGLDRFNLYSEVPV